MPSATMSEIRDLLPNTVYLTFNQPEKNEYHRGIFITTAATAPAAATTPPSSPSPSPSPSPSDKAPPPPPPPTGTLFHAVFANNVWGLERRTVHNICASKSLVLLWRVAPLSACFSVDAVQRVLQQVPCRADHSTDNEAEGRAHVDLDLDIANAHAHAGVEYAQYADKGGFSCVPWTENALRALRDEGVISVSRDIRAIVKEARARAGPEDAKLMVGKDFGGLRVVN